MTQGKAKNTDEAANAQNKELGSAKEQETSNTNSTSELREPRWSVVSFETRVAKNLSYEEAERKIAELESQKIAGLCLITDEAAERISKQI